LVIGYWLLVIGLEFGVIVPVKAVFY